MIATLFLSRVISDLHASSIAALGLEGEIWRTSFPTMASFRPVLENLLVALESNRSLVDISVSKDMLALIGESDQARLFCALGNLPSLRFMSMTGGSPGSPTVIHTRVLAEALTQTSNGIRLLHISGFELSTRSQVEQLADGLKNRSASLERLTLEDIVLGGEDTTGSLDPILIALASASAPHGQLLEFRFSCHQAVSNGSSIVSPEALGSFFVCNEQSRQSGSSLYLQNLGLDDNHCKAMAEQMAKDKEWRNVHILNLCGNPSIGQEGYQALLGLLNRKFNIRRIDVDDQSWKAKFDLVIYMNNVFDRGLFLKDGAFLSKAMQMNFLDQLTTNYCEPNKMLNFIWYTLRENPSLIYA